MFHLKLDPLKKRYLLAALSGILLALATPPLKLGFIAWFAMIPLFIAIEKAENKKESYWLGVFFGFPYLLGTIYWIVANFGAVWGARIGSFVGAVVVLSAWFGLITYLHKILITRYAFSGHWLAIILWTAQEVVRTTGELAFPWPIFALTQAYYLPVTQIISVGGSALMALWVLAINVLLMQKQNRRRSQIIVMFMILLTFAIGTVRIKLIENKDQKTIGKVAIVQGNVDADKKWKLGSDYSFDIYESITRSLLQEKPDLIIWPETAIPTYLQKRGVSRRRIQAFTDSVGIPIATGASHYEYEERIKYRYNSCFLVRPGGKGKFDIYSKYHLVPFGERVPFQKIIPQLGKLNFGQAEFKPGESIVVWEVKNDSVNLAASPFICYESIFPDLGLIAVNNGANLILNHTNDGWLRGTGEPEQHLLLSSLRSIETGRCLARATNTGISAFVLQSGRIIKKLPEDIRGGMVYDISEPVDTIYLRGGWLTGYIVLIATIIFYTVVFFKNVRKSRKRPIE